MHTNPPPSFRSTSNETLSFGNDLKSSLHVLYPQLTDEDLDEFAKVYDPAQFSSETEWYRAATGEPFLRCGVRDYIILLYSLGCNIYICPSLYL